MAMRGTIHAVHQALLRVMIDASIRHGEEGRLALQLSEITVDRDDQGLVATVWFAGKAIRSIPYQVGRSLLEQPETASLERDITAAMLNHLDLIGQVHYTRLAKLFPGSIREVEMGFSPLTASKTVKVYFKNGHTAEADERASHEDEFLARCVMLHDLPPVKKEPDRADD